MKFYQFYEKEYIHSDLDMDRVYELFRDSYLKATGKAWSKEKFISRSKNYKFFGDENGYVMARVQNSGLYKLIGSAGNSSSIMKGIKELLELNKPVWGMVAKELVKPLQRLKFVSPPLMLMKAIAKEIPPNVFGVNKIKMNDDGSVTVDYEDVGEATKYFVANKKYYEWMIDKAPVSEFIKTMVKAFIVFI